MTEKYSVLIVDDALRNIQIVASFLKEENYRFFYATTGEDALKVINNKKVDLILLDIMMPDVNGFEVCKNIREIKRDVPIIFLTARHDEESVKEGFRVGGSDYIRKPFNKDELIARVRSHLDLYTLRLNLESRVEEEIEKREVQEQVLIQTSKMAAFGEMMRSIAHQWRQPISSMFIIVQELNYLADEKMLSEETASKISSSVMNKLKFMSETIDDFKNFFSENKIYTEFSVKDEIDKIVDILKPQFKQHEISVILNDSDIKGYGVINEFKQVILNIFNNAKDVLVEREVVQPKIEVTIEKKEERAVIAIKDNGGGVPKEIEEKIFLRDYTTKEEGSGIGLYICKIIVEEHLSGTIELINGKEGASFKISIPLFEE